MINYPKVSIIVINWNGVEDAIECLESLKKMIYPNYEVIVVDNASVGNDVELLKQRFGEEIHIIENDMNYGFAEGCNIGIRYARDASSPDYIMLLCNDIVVAPDLLTELVLAAEANPEIGIVGVTIYQYNSQGKSNVIESLGGKITPWRHPIYRSIKGNSEALSRYTVLLDREWVAGGAMMLKNRVIEKVGLLNPYYFFGDEDVDYCLRAKKQGFKIICIPSAKVWHKGSTARIKIGMDTFNVAQSYRLIKENFPRPVYIYHLLLLPIKLLRWILYWLVKSRHKKSMMMFFSSFRKFIVDSRNSKRLSKLFADFC